jgi:predicted porin
MKKTLVAWAVLSAFAGTAAAQSSVSIYGIVDLWVGSTKSGLGAQSVTSLDNGGLSPSRLGFKGSEDLGGGLSAVFTIEGNLTPDNGTAGRLAFDRQSYVGLEGGFGAVHFGRVWTSFYDVEALAFTSFDSAFTPEYYAFGSVDYTGNPNNGIKYVSPEFGGFTGTASYAIDEKNGAANEVKTGALGLSYTGGPLTAVVAYQQEKATGTPNSLSFTRISAAYDLGVVVLKGNYGTAKDNLSDAKSKDYSLGVDVPLSEALTLGAGYARGKDNAAGGSDKRSAYGLAATYGLSKRTTVYAGITKGETKNGGVKTDEENLYAVGLRHTF